MSQAGSASAIRSNKASPKPRHATRFHRVSAALLLVACTASPSGAGRRLHKSGHAKAREDETGLVIVMK
jgi:hypothetical protein